MDLQPSGTTVGRALDALNFFLADVRDGLGPYLAIYLPTERGDIATAATSRSAVSTRRTSWRGSSPDRVAIAGHALRTP